VKQLDAKAGGRNSLLSRARRVASTSAIAAFALIATSGAKADVVETFNLSGKLNTFPFLGAPVPFTGTFELDFSDDFSGYQYGPLSITVQGRSVFTRVAIVSAAGSILAHNGSGDTLSLSFNASGTWNEFNHSTIGGGEVIFGGVTGLLLGADGVLTRVAGPPILPAVVDPPPITSAAVPELSTWTMMLVGLAGLWLAAKRRRALAFLGGRA
jgi:hypothetical protein